MVLNIINQDGRMLAVDERKIARSIMNSLERVGNASAAGPSVQVLPLVEDYLQQHYGAWRLPSDRIAGVLEREMLYRAFDVEAERFIKLRDETFEFGKFDQRFTIKPGFLWSGTGVPGTLERLSEIVATTASMDRCRINLRDIDVSDLVESCPTTDLDASIRTAVPEGSRTGLDGIFGYADYARELIMEDLNCRDRNLGRNIIGFDHGLAPGVAETYLRSYIENLVNAFMLLKEIGGIRTLVEKRCIEDMVSRIGEETGLRPGLDAGHLYLASELTFLTDLVDGDLALAQRIQRFAITAAESETDRLTYLAMEDLIRNLNANTRRSGSSTRFTTIQYGTDISCEGRMVAKNFMFAMGARLVQGSNPIFPINLFLVEEGVNCDPSDPNFDLFLLASKISGNWLFPIFQVAGEPSRAMVKEAGFVSDLSGMYFLPL